MLVLRFLNGIACQVSPIARKRTTKKKKKGLRSGSSRLKFTFRRALIWHLTFCLSCPLSLYVNSYSRHTVAGERSFLQRSTPFCKTSFTLLPSHPEAVHRLSSVDSVVRRFARAPPQFCSEEIDFCLETWARIDFFHGNVSLSLQLVEESQSWEIEYKTEWTMDMVRSSSNIIFI